MTSLMESIISVITLSQEQLGDVVYAELPEVGRELVIGGMLVVTVQLL